MELTHIPPLVLMMTTLVAVGDAANPERCVRQPTPGLCPKIWNKYYYNTLLNTCVQANRLWGCLKKSNVFYSMVDCQRTCYDADRLCTLPEKTGGVFCPGGKKERWHYDEDTETCSAFDYRGGKWWCNDEGNGNNFVTKGDCKQRCLCSEAKQSDDSIADCGTTESRYWYDKDSNRCEMYTGCETDPQGNNFESEDLCDATCRYQLGYCSEDTSTTYDVDEALNKCDVDDQLTQYRYDSDTDSCEAYAGCSTDRGNTFQSQDDCEMYCLVDDSDE